MRDKSPLLKLRHYFSAESLGDDAENARAYDADNINRFVYTWVCDGRKNALRFGVHTKNAVCYLALDTFMGDIVPLTDDNAPAFSQLEEPDAGEVVEIAYQFLKALPTIPKKASEEILRTLDLSDERLKELQTVLAEVLEHPLTDADLDKFLAARNFDPDMKPIEWRSYSNQELMQYPITRAILEYKRSAG